MRPGRILGYAAWIVFFTISVYVGLRIGEPVLVWVLIGLFVVWAVSSWIVEKQAAVRRRADREEGP
ncbi:hypothetical protein AVL61_15905 [Kocuria rosea subsp. polaris]|uniref:Uncharacterized protein n=1 Tax=Kocuria rosea subsp. polaris TaxID=136273 RepID=A0A0W8I1V9_KOCRO|nr:hypothetical protein [Kocuria polaris]KUG51723.1 hypothetical protein AVL61_15905 [Kocuria polaris]